MKVNLFKKTNLLFIFSIIGKPQQASLILGGKGFANRFKVETVPNGLK